MVHDAPEARHSSSSAAAPRSTTARIDWGHAEALAFALAAARRRADAADGPGHRARHVLAPARACCTTSRPARRTRRSQHLTGARRRFEIHNSPLTEAACLGFEYGYSVTRPDALVLWEAQYGDFANGAQVIIDQFIASAESSGARSRGSTLLLPHGYEGNGPEHRSARLERFLKLGAEDNMHGRQPDDAGAALPPAAAAGAAIRRPLW